ncbi:extracellular solute-binding protein [Nonomuraea sp. NPDC005650]|uniref:ABC transporter substrate-binding protein n=1 Tax=Nonomuraea sp. NPDC005650 TaxID=3157045 RepID=UPI0033B41BD0
MHSDNPGPSRRSILRYGAAATGLTALALAGCAPSGDGRKSGGGRPAGNVALRMSAFGSTVRQQKLRQVYDLYTKKRGGSVELALLANDAYAQKLATEIAGGAAADTIALFQHIVAQYALKNALTPLDDYVPSVLNISQFDQSSIAGGVIKGKRAALPLGDNAYGTIYDKSALDAIGMSVPKPGHTWDDFIAFANDVRKKSGGAYYGTVDDSGDFNGFQVFVRQRGKELYKDGKLGVSPDDVRAWFEIWAELRKTGAAPPGDLTVQAASGGFGTTLLVGKKAPNLFIYPNVLGALQALTKTELAVTTMPMPSAAQSGHFLRASNWVGVYGRSEHPADAVDLVNFIVNDEQAVKVLQAEFGAPPNLQLRKSITYNQVDRLFVDYVDLVAKEFAHPVPSLADEFPGGSPQVMTAFVTTSQSIATGRQTIPDGVDSFLSQASGFLT